MNTPIRLLREAEGTNQGFVRTPKKDEPASPLKEGEKEIKASMIYDGDLPTPIGDFIFAQQDIKPIEHNNGFFYHYGHVIVLLKRYSKSLSPAPVEQGERTIAYYVDRLQLVSTCISAMMFNLKKSTYDSNLQELTKIKNTITESLENNRVEQGEEKDKEVAGWKKEYEAMRLDNFRQDKEIERLKGLIKAAYKAGAENERHDEGVWEDFETKNNL